MRRLRLWAGFLVVLLPAMAVAQSVPDRPLAIQVQYKPKFQGDPAHSEPEAAALGYMRTVVQAQRDYHKKFGHYATSLSALVGGSRSFTRRMTKTDRGDYTVGFRGGREGYSVALTPKAFDTMHRAFYTDSSGRFRAEPDKPATADSPLLTAD
jgi:hypothetical protein